MDAKTRGDDSTRLQRSAHLRSLLNRRDVLMGGAAFAAGGIAAFGAPATALANDGSEDELAGLWHDVITSPGVPTVQTFEIYGGGIFIGSGNFDLTQAFLSSSIWGIWERRRPREFRATGRYWTYFQQGSPAGIGTIDYTVTVDEDAKAFQGSGTAQFFDANLNPLTPAAPIHLSATRIEFTSGPV